MPTVTQPGVIKVQVGSTAVPTISSISYGNRTLRGASDLILDGAQNGYVIVYREGNFFVQSVASATTTIDNGFF
jgi:hypothetical protein